MQLREVSDIIIPADRQRQHFEPSSIADLAASIAEVGLLHPPVVTPSGILVAGERRLRAIEQLYSRNRLFSCDGAPIPAGKVPTIGTEELEAVLLHEAEFAENILREPLTWQERTRALARLHELRLTQNPKQSYLDTAEETADADGRSVAGEAQVISRAMIIAGSLDDPDVAGARDEGEAWSILSRKMEAKILGNMDAPAKSKHTLIPGRIEHANLASATTRYSCIIADPPYGIAADEFGDAAKEEHSYDDTRESALSISRYIIDLATDISTKQAHLWMFCDIDLFTSLRDYAIERDWRCWRVPAVWYKGATGHAPWGPYGMQRVHEFLLCAVKGGKSFNTLKPDVIDRIPNLRQRQHAAQKPVELYYELLSRSTTPGDYVLDPCCGSGTIFPAAESAKVYATGVEADANYHSIALQRLEETNAKPTT